jgi:predicted alpha/beta superfamily hydrolase
MSGMLHGCLADTDYLEVTAKSGHRYGVWVTTPLGYADSTDSMPLIYVLDGNFAVGLTAPLIVTQSDLYLSIAPYIQVTVGYAGEEAEQWTKLRNRDLVPPGEPVSEDVVAALKSAVDSGAMPQEHMDAYVAELADSHADVFLDFLTEELHPQLTSQYRVSDSGHGLFGYSYGGLFALYAWLRETSLFATVGAGSAGVAVDDSQVFELIRKLPDRGEDASERLLHLTINEAELIGEVPIYRRLAQRVLTVVEQLTAKGWSPDISKALLHGTHVTGIQESFLSYLKTCHVRRP